MHFELIVDEDLGAFSSRIKQFICFEAAFPSRQSKRKFINGFFPFRRVFVVRSSIYYNSMGIMRTECAYIMLLFSSSFFFWHCLCLAIDT